MLTRTFAFLLVLPTLPLAAEPIDFQPLLGRSPFGQPPAAPVEAPVETPNLEFRGMVVEGGVRYFSVFNLSNQQGEWVREGDSRAMVQVSGFDAENNLLTVTQNGRPVRLALREASITTMAAPAAPTQAAGRPGGERRPATGSAPAAAPSAADAQRLEAIAAEVRRRRALRQAAGGEGAPQ